ncbi:23135_t:CDS:2, partial [Gigaspora rosea]
ETYDVILIKYYKLITERFYLRDLLNVVSGVNYDEESAEIRSKFLFQVPKSNPLNYDEKSNETSVSRISSLNYNEESAEIRSIPKSNSLDYDEKSNETSVSRVNEKEIDDKAVSAYSIDLSELDNYPHIKNIVSRNGPKIFEEPVDNTLLRLSQDQKFTDFLQKSCNDNHARYEDVKKCVSGLYHQVSKNFHGHGSIMISAQTWSPNEILALMVILKYYKVPWSYSNTNGVLEDCPYKISL